jgi:hypothetical protein
VGRVDAIVPGRVRRAFLADALFEVVCGAVLMGNPLLGPQLGISGFVVALVGVLLLLAAIFLGGAGLGKGLLAGRLPLVAALNALSAAVLLAWAGLGSLDGTAQVFVAVIGLALVALCIVQVSAIRKPHDTTVRLPPTKAELAAALRGESPTHR